jgi:hypothetical protein
MTMPSMSAEPSSSFALTGVRAYLAERFPVPVIFTLALAIGLGSYAAAQAATLEAGLPLLIDGTALGGVALVFLFLLHLRVFDEHKDFALDAATRPDRPVQRGLVTLGQLKVLGAVAIAAEVVIAFLPGAGPGVLYLAVIGYSVLMLFEFFARDWLAARIHWYALSHTLVMGLMAVALAARFTLRADLALPLEVWVIAALNVSGAIGIDVLRKTWAPESEVAGLDSYSKRLGIRGAAILGAIVVAVTALLGGWAGWMLGGGPVWLLIDAAIALWGFSELRGFARAPSPGRAKRLEAVSGVQLLALLFGIAIIAATRAGVLVALAGETWMIGG